MSKGNLTVLGVGRLGICVALNSERKGYNVLGVDVIPHYVEQLNNKTFQSPEPYVTQYLQESKNFRATLSLDEGLVFSDKIFLLVATPTGIGEKSYDHSHLSNLLMQIVVGCTVLPGYMSTVGRYLLRDCKNVTLSYNPEFIAGEGDKSAGFLLSLLSLFGVERWWFPPNR
eukprot:TRINITY_DN1542_c0_g1_i1.p2 TRINITY_DN1542_c0_g1~~TRINITY_DN1542_c0_g1_i1.p2  ORF type:complete len:171 (-),score=18.00 TRINITY_DN1542_c0_g1_i1:736-1248(-)